MHNIWRKLTLEVVYGMFMYEVNKLSYFKNISSRFHKGKNNMPFKNSK